jgi:hypothetical protein
MRHNVFLMKLCHVATFVKIKLNFGQKNEIDI